MSVSSVKSRLIAIFGTPESSTGATRVVMLGDKVCIENHRGIEKLDDGTVIVRLKNGCVRITGSGLCVRRLRREDIAVCGKIDGICFAGEPQ